uniref:Uncharacterized protein n=1 Tax=Arundo donax TaxID=35708 RepID=A0A0A9FSV3_ARUDO
MEAGDCNARRRSKTSQKGRGERTDQGGNGEERNSPLHSGRR